MKKEIKAYIEAELRNYHSSKKDLEEIKEDILHSGPNNDSMGIRGSGNGDSTGSKAIRLITNKRIKRLEQTIRAIDIVVGELDEEKYKLVQLRYWKRPRLLSDMGIAKELNIDRATLYRWINAIVLAIAVEMGLEDDPKLQQKCDF